eukprot:gnl/Chilomastix_cuspidata/1448.p1 GENE.gnl/Chilomastix_cuspidata/1448~~gnl/Chilomastix_cuspidata/1448.p1  ORF type:complete len:416 (+),score=78.58 gnl/Chilomastix_cuspidata/1448:145-1248(+)
MKKTNQIFLRSVDSICANQVRIDTCKGCSFYIIDVIDSVIIDELTDCTVVLAVVKGSVFIRDCHNCNFVIASQQLRTRDCTDLNISLYSFTNPIIELSQRLRFFPFRLAMEYSGTDASMEAQAREIFAHLVQRTFGFGSNHFANVFDFSANEGADTMNFSVDFDARALPFPAVVPPRALLEHDIAVDLPGSTEPEKVARHIPIGPFFNPFVPPEVAAEGTENLLVFAFATLGGSSLLWAGTFAQELWEAGVFVRTVQTVPVELVRHVVSQAVPQVSLFSMSDDSLRAQNSVFGPPFVRVSEILKSAAKGTLFHAVHYVARNDIVFRIDDAAKVALKSFGAFPANIAVSAAPCVEALRSLDTPPRARR